MFAKIKAHQYDNGFIGSFCVIREKLVEAVGQVRGCLLIGI